MEARRLDFLPWEFVSLTSLHGILSKLSNVKTPRVLAPTFSRRFLGKDTKHYHIWCHWLTLYAGVKRVAENKQQIIHDAFFGSCDTFALLRFAR